MDDLTRINGIGKATAERLAAAGLDSFERLAHDGIAGEHGIRVEWISEAARLHHENTQEKPPRSDDDQGTVDGAPADGGAGDPHTDTSQADDQGGAGNPVGPAGGLADPHGDTEIAAPSGPAGWSTRPAPKALVIGTIDLEGMTDAEAEAAGADMIAEGRRRYPHLAAAVDAWREIHGDEAAPQGIRIAARRAGFRRCNMDHPKAATDHPADRFTPDELERLLAEPMLTVELV